jgi:Holliday junction DNA helicase RuvA
MIGRLTGRLYEKSPPRIGVDVQGVGYEIDVSMATFYNLPEIGAEITLLTHMVVREDAQLLYGFSSVKERSAFKELIKVSGIGARIALAVLSGLSVDDLARAVTTQETDRLIRVPGIGKKTAERLLLELKGKFGALEALGTGAVASSQGDILAALLALGYSERECSTTLKALPDGIDVSAGIKLALKNLAR